MPDKTIIIEMIIYHSLYFSELLPKNGGFSLEIIENQKGMEREKYYFGCSLKYKFLCANSQMLTKWPAHSLV